VADVASWINYFYTDQSTTGTGLDKIVDTIKSDAGLARNTTAADINAGANYANQLNQLLIQSITATNAMADGWITAEDLRAMNAWVNSDATRLAAYIALHGDDETTGEETGYHLVQNDGATTNYFGRNLINGVADSIYHFGFTIQGNNLLNEDGAVNASLSDVGNWVNYFYKGSTWINGDATAETITGGATGEEIVARGGADVVDGGAGDDLIWGGDGNDTLRGGAGADLLDAGGGSDLLDGGADADTYRVTGNAADPLGFHGYNTFADSGTSGRDRLLAFGSGNVDVGLQGWNGSIEEVDASGVTGQARLIADNNPNLLDFRTTTLIGNLVIDGSYGSDTIYGSTGADSIIGGAVEDFIDGGEGGDTYLVYGNETLGWAGWSACDTYTDTGTSGTDVLKAVGPGDVDIGLTGWGARTGIELLDITGAAGRVRLVGNSAGNTIDLRNTALVGSGVVLDAGAGYDTVYATTGNDTLIAGTGNDLLAGGAGNDVYQVSGNQAAGLGVFNGIDTYQDSAGQDTLVASGVGDVDIGLTGWTATTGIETLNASGVTGTTRLLGDDYANTFDLRSTQLLGSGFVLDGGRGNDTIWGTAAAETIVGGGGDDVVDGGAGDDTYRVNGVAAGGWDSFHGYDSYSDAAGNDRLIAVGTGDVDIGMKSWGTTGIETIDTTGAAGTTRLLGDGGNNLLDFRSTTLLGSRIVLDAGGGHDVLYGTAAADTIDGGTGNDTLYGGTGNDTYRVSRGSATDRISDDSGSLDQMVFGTGVSADQLWFRHVGNDLEVRIIGTVDIVSISNWYLGSANHVEQFRTADGRVLLDTQVDNLVSAMAGFSPPGWAVTTLPANYQTTLLPVINGNWA
jgi:Ca2+-binding RTX toxin-like protein